MVTFTLDIGNTNVKLVVWDDKELISQFKSENVEYDIIKETIKKYSIDKGIISTVRGDGEEIKEKIETIAGISPIVFNQNEIKKLKNRIFYRQPIGTDRIAAYMGAETLYPGIAKMVVDVGTALTLDVIDRNGDFCGGDISLGLKSRLKALHLATAELPDVEVEGLNDVFGKDTVTAILSGAINGITGEILFAIERAKKKYGIDCVLLTGGDGELFSRLLKDRGVGCEYVTNLVNMGLDTYLRQDTRI